MTLINILGYTAALCTALSFVPQVYKIIRTRNTEGISLIMYALCVTGVFLWLIYGILIWSFPVIFANALTLTLSAFYQCWESLHSVSFDRIKKWKTVRNKFLPLRWRFYRAIAALHLRIRNYQDWRADFVLLFHHLHLDERKEYSLKEAQQLKRE